MENRQIVAVAPKRMPVTETQIVAVAPKRMPGKRPRVTETSVADGLEVFPAERRMYVALTVEQSGAVMEHGIVRRSWFGPGWSVPLKWTEADAREAGAMSNAETECMATWVCTEPLWNRLVREGRLVETPWVKGIRLKQDVMCCRPNMQYDEGFLGPDEFSYWEF